MSKNNFGIKSTFDAFVALNKILEEEKPSLKKKLKNKKLKEGVSVDLRSDAELEAAKKMRSEKKDDTTLEVIDVDADAVDQIQNNDSYIGKMLLQCVSCRATRFMDIDDLKQDENDKDLYNLEDECPHCHHKGSGYYLVGQVGKTPDQEEEEPAVDNDEASNDEAVFDNTEDVEDEEVEEETPEETPTEEKPENNDEEEEKDFTETDSEDDTDDLDLASLGDEFNVDDIVTDDTEEEDEEDKTKKESLEEGLFNITPNYTFQVGDTFTTPIDFEDDAFVADTVYEIVELDNGKYGIEYENLNYPYVSGGKGIVDIFEEDSLEDLSRQIFDYDPHISMEMINRFDPYASYRYGENNGEDERAMASEFDKYKTEGLEEDKNNGFYRVEYHRILPSNIFRNDNQHDYMYVFARNGGYANQYVASHINQAMIDKVEEVKFSDIPDDEKIADSIAWWDSNSIHYLYEDMDKDLEEDLDMATFEGSIANLIDTFTIEDHPVNVKVLNKNGSELGIYSSDDLPFTIKSQMMDTFNTEDNFLELNVTREGEGTTVNDLFNYYRPDEDNQTTFLVTDVDTEEENEYEELADLLENYGDYYIDGALGLRTLNIYIADGDLETEVEPLDDEEIEELGKENAEKDESLTEGAKYSKNYPFESELNKIVNTIASNSAKGNTDNFDELLKKAKLIKRAWYKYCPEQAKEYDRKHGSKVTEESLIEEIIKCYPRLKLNRINNPLSEEYFIAESIRLNEDLDLVYNNFVKYSNNKELIEHFKSYTGYEDEVDKFLREHNISKEKYDKIINEPVNKVVKSKARVIENKTAEKLFASVTGRAQLGEAINKLVKAKEKYRIAKSLREGYRYDIFVNSTCKLNEGLFDLTSTDDSNVDVIDGEVVDRETPEATTTQLVPEGMSEQDIEIVNKIDRIAGDICDAIEEVYNIPAREKKPYVAADIIRDLQLVGGEVLADDLEDTPWNNLTREMYNQFNGFYDALDDLVSFVTGQRVTTSQAEKLRQAIESLDGPQFTREAIRANIASPRFLDAARRGYVPYVSPQEISTSRTNRNNRNRFLEQCDDKITEDVNPKLVDMDGDIEDPNFNLASFAKTTVTESAKDLQEFGNAEDVEKRLDELQYLKTQRELNDEEQEEYDYCLQLLGKEYEEEEYPIDLEEFDSGINEYFAESDDVLGYTSKKIKKDGNDFIVEGLVENWDSSKPITFIIKKNEGKDNYTVSNDLFEDKFTLDL